MHPISDEILDVASLDPLIIQYSDVKLSYFFGAAPRLLFRAERGLVSARVSR